MTGAGKAGTVGGGAASPGRTAQDIEAEVALDFRRMMDGGTPLARTQEDKRSHEEGAQADRAIQTAESDLGRLDKLGEGTEPAEDQIAKLI